MTLFNGYAKGFGSGGVSTPDPITIKPVSSEAPSILKQAIKQYQPGGTFATARAEQLGRRERTVTAGMEAGLVGRGLAGTTVGAAIPAAVEQQVSAPWRTETEMMRGARLMEAVLAQAGFTERQTAREQEVAIANAQMELQQRLANKQINIQEYNAATARLSARGAGGGTTSTIGRHDTLSRDTKKYAGTTGAADIPYLNELLKSLDEGEGNLREPGDIVFPAGGGGAYGYTSEQEAFAKTKGIPVTSMQRGSLLSSTY